MAEQENEKEERVGHRETATKDTATPEASVKPSLLRVDRRTAMRLMVNLVWDEEYKGYVADVPELPGCMSQGKTVDAAIANVKEAISLYLETSPRRRTRRRRPALTTTVEV